MALRTCKKCKQSFDRPGLNALQCLPCAKGSYFRKRLLDIKNRRVKLMRRKRVNPNEFTKLDKAYAKILERAA